MRWNINFIACTVMRLSLSCEAEQMHSKHRLQASRMCDWQTHLLMFVLPPLLPLFPATLLLRKKLQHVRQWSDR